MSEPKFTVDFDVVPGQKPEAVLVVECNGCGTTTRHPMRGLKDGAPLACSGCDDTTVVRGFDLDEFQGAFDEIDERLAKHVRLDWRRSPD